jgi:transcriptional regulator with XRE-family HTH domain
MIFEGNKYYFCSITYNIINMNIRVKDICKEKGITITQLAEKLNIKQESLSRAINGNPTFETLQRIATALNVPFTDLFEAPAQNTITCPKCGARLEVKEK